MTIAARLDILTATVVEVSPDTSGRFAFPTERGAMRRIDPLDEARAHVQATLAHCVAEHDWFGYHATLAYWRTLGVDELIDAR